MSNQSHTSDEIAARGALVGIGGLTVLMSDNTGTNIQSPTLAEMEESLSHAAAKDFLSPKPKGEKKGERAFDESAVKRDGSGQFAKQASSKKAGVDPKDAAWLKNLTDERINDIMARDKNYKRLMDTYDQAWKKHGLKTWNAFDKAPKATQNAVLKTAATMLNRDLIPTIKEFKSPTGKAQVKIVMVGKDFEVRIVDKASGTTINPAPVRVRPNAVDARVRHSESPSVAEMRDILEDDGEALSHFGIKGMKWGVRRSRKELGRLRNDDGEDVGGLRASTRKAANKLRSMKPGETIVIDDGEKGPKIYTKQPDGTFKQTHLAADTERFMRTMTKDPSEMSTKEIQDATKRAQAVEAYNKMFNPYGDPNHELRLKAEAMKLEAEYRKAYAQINPPPPSMAKKLGTFINDMTPAYNVFKAADKAVNNKFSNSFKDIFGALNTAQANVGNSGSTNPMGSTGNTKKTASYPFTATKSKTSANRVYDITDLGKDDYLNPFIAELEGRR